MELNPHVCSADGYIIRQQALHQVPFGGSPSRNNGCGWIAAFNLLHALGHPVQWQRVRQELSRQLPGSRKGGLQLGALLGYLHGQGCRLRCACTLTGARLLAERSRAGIIMYSTGQGNHYVAFVRQADGRLRMLNTAPGCEDMTLSLRQFYQGWVQLPLMILIGVP